jgi:hypothetical protein
MQRKARREPPRRWWSERGRGRSLPPIPEGSGRCSGAVRSKGMRRQVTARRPGVEASAGVRCASGAWRVPRGNEERRAGVGGTRRFRVRTLTTVLRRASTIPRRVMGSSDATSFSSRRLKRGRSSGPGGVLLKPRFESVPRAGTGARLRITLVEGLVVHNFVDLLTTKKMQPGLAVPPRHENTDALARLSRRGTAVLKCPAQLLKATRDRGRVGV